MRRSFITLGLLLAAGSPSFAQGWGGEMFDHTSHDFGMVARGQKVQHCFPIENVYVEDVIIEAVYSSCSCITAKVTKKRLKTFEKGEIVAVVDTARFLGHKDATFRVNLTCQTKEGLLRDEVQLHCYAYIRSDVVLEPGTIRFDSVPYGTALAAKKVSISYAGRNDWKIVRVESDNPHLDLKYVQTGRQMGQVSYDLFVGLKAGAPVGYLRDQVILVTNDRDAKATHIMVPVEGLVTPTISAKPSPLMLGLVNPGQAVERTLIVRSKTAFRILEVSGPNDRFRFEFTDQPKTLHVIPVTFTAGDTPGAIAGEIRIRTDSPGSEVLQVKFHGRVVAPNPAESSDDSAQSGEKRGRESFLLTESA